MEHWMRTITALAVGLEEILGHLSFIMVVTICCQVWLQEKVYAMRPLENITRGESIYSDSVCSCNAVVPQRSIK